MTAMRNTMTIAAGSAPRPVERSKGGARKDRLAQDGRGRQLTLANGRVLSVRVANEISAFRAEWRSLQSSSIATPFQHYEWVNAWQAHVGRSLSCRAMPVVAYDGEQPVCILPLGIMPKSKGSCLTWLGSDLNDYCAPLIAEALLKSITVEDVHNIMRMVADAAGTRGASFAYLPKQPITIAGLDNQFARYRSFDYSCMAHSARIDGSWADYFKRRRGKSTRRRIAQKTRRLEAKGAVDFRTVGDKNELLDTIHNTLAWKQAQLQDRVARNLLARSEVEDFLAELVAKPGADGPLCGYELTLDGKAIATAFGFMSDDSFILYQTAYEPGAHTECSPGLLLLTRMMEDCGDRGLDVFDFSLGDEPYKFQWSDEHLELRTSCFALRARGILHAQLMCQASALKRFAKSHVATISTINSVIKYFRS